MNCSLVDKVSNFLCALGAIAWGLMFFGIDVFSLPFVVHHLHFLVKPIQILVGLAGCYSLISLFTCSDSCGSKK